MKRLTALLHHALLCTVLIACAPMLTACGLSHIEPGEVGVQINSCSGGGVNKTPAAIGYHLTGVCTTIVNYPVTIQTAVWTHDVGEGHPANEEITFSNADNMAIAVDVSISYHIDTASAAEFYSRFKVTDLSLFTHGMLRNLTRDAFNDVAGTYKKEIFEAVRGSGKGRR